MNFNFKFYLWKLCFRIYRLMDGWTDELIWGGLGNLLTVPPGKIPIISYYFSFNP